MTFFHKQHGFTLIEILLAIGILAILATAVIVAINPSRQFAEARNSQRWNDLHALVNAVNQYSIGHKGVPPPEVPSGGNPIEICNMGALICSGIVGMPSLIDGGYLTSLPVDPSCPSACDTEYTTGYFITTNADGRVYVLAPKAELGETISLVQ